MEVDIDVGSSSVAAAVVGLVQGATRSLVVDMGIVLEGHSREELPEALLGTVRAAPGAHGRCAECVRKAWGRSGTGVLPAMVPRQPGKLTARVRALVAVARLARQRASSTRLLGGP